jgi:hypothetical protein
MRSHLRLGAVNAALVASYFALVWGTDAIRALTSPFSGFELPAHAAAASYFRALFDLNLDGLIRTANVLAGIKLVIAVGFLAYLIEFFRAIAMRREPNRETLDTVLAFTAVAIMLWAWPALASGSGALIRIQATQFLMLTGAMIVLLVERHLDELAEAPQAVATASSMDIRSAPAGHAAAAAPSR